ncbi:asparaginase-domain-containing protein [Syncephalis fuscata]|nr:asparaginase-domain-containing protein [Syncephalis fuscata]
MEKDLNIPASVRLTKPSLSGESVESTNSDVMFESPAVKLQTVADRSSMLMPDISRVLVIYTGGTIGMKNSKEKGYIPVPDYLGKTLETMARFHDPKGLEQLEALARKAPSEQTLAGVCVAEKLDTSRIDGSRYDEQQLHWLIMPQSMYGKRIRYAILEYDPLLDSSNMTMDGWIQIATDIEANYKDFDSFIILHGTDTMAYTASALSFLLEHLGKTVIVTGSQVPISEVRNDGVENLLSALTIAGHYVIPEVCLYFNNSLFRGNRSSKVDAVDFDAFDSPNLRPLAKVGININVAWPEVLHPDRIARFRAHKKMNPNVATLRIFPGITEATVRAFLTPPIQGVVLETYGAGNAPNNRPELLRALREATDNGIVIVNCSQCTRGLVSTLYATAKPLIKAGVVPGSDMTAECALTKLSYLLSKYPPEKCRELIQRTLRGEMTIIHEQQRFSLPHKNRAVVRAVLSATRPSVGTAQDWNTVDEYERAEVEHTLYPVLLCFAAASGDLEGLHAMEQSFGGVLQLNCVDYNGSTPLHLASGNGHVTCVEYLLLHGASVHVLDRLGHTPLFIAARFKQKLVVDLLRKAGAHFNDKELSEVTHLLQHAAAVGDLKTIKILVSAGVDLDRINTDGRTALHKAASENQYDVAEYLISKGVSMQTQDFRGDTPLEDARRSSEKHQNAIKSVLDLLTRHSINN